MLHAIAVSKFSRHAIAVASRARVRHVLGFARGGRAGATHSPDRASAGSSVPGSPAAVGASTPQPKTAGSAAGARQENVEPRLRKVCAQERPGRDPPPGPLAAVGRREPLVSRRAGERASGAFWFCAPVRTLDVRGLAPRGARVRSSAGVGRRHQRQRHHQLGSHELLRNSPARTTRARAVDRERPHGLHAGRAGPGAAGCSARGREERTPPDLRERALRSEYGGPARYLVPEGHAVPRRHHRLDGGSRRGPSSATCAPSSSRTTLRATPR